MIKKYRKKPLEIEAIQWNGYNDQEIENFIGEKLIYYGDNLVAYFPKSQQYQSKLIYIQTPKGTMTARVNDYIIKNIKGEFYPCNPKAFKETYELIS